LTVKLTVTTNKRLHTVELSQLVHYTFISSKTAVFEHKTK